MYGMVVFHMSFQSRRRDVYLQDFITMVDDLNKVQEQVCAATVLTAAVLWAIKSFQALRWSPLCPCSIASSHASGALVFVGGW